MTDKLPTVFLVGAGPGDPDLLTIKAAKAIARATVILVDDLVNPEIVEQHRLRTARVTWVGKRGGCKSTPQAFIERLIIREALAGEIVVRLKGGDPMIFGRGGEEMLALTEAGIRFEVISGITSAVAASASIQASLTHRDHSHGVVFATAHPRADSSGTELDWPSLLKSGLSLVLYMGMQRADWIRDQALLAGLPVNLPVCVVQSVSCANQVSLRTTLDLFPQAMAEHAMRSPAVLMFGQAFGSAVATHNIVYDLNESRQPRVLETARDLV